MASSFIGGGFHINIARCEQCGSDVLFLNWPAGWMQTGESKYGTQYCDDGVAWWCPICRTEHETPLAD